MHNCAKEFQKLNKDYNYHFYDDKKAREFLIDNFESDVLEAFDILIPGAFKADLFRICELYINGGYYADICMTPLIDFSYFIKYNAELILVRDKNYNDIYNAFIYAKCKHPFIGFLVEKTTENVLARNFGENVLDITGPKFIGRCWREFYNTSIEIGYNDSTKTLVLDYNSGSVFDFDKKLFNTKYENWELDRPPKSRYSELYKNKMVFKN